MSFGLGLNNPPAQISPEVAATATLMEKLRVEQVLKGSAGWFLWVAGLSAVNSILHLSGVKFQFIFGLGIAQLVDALAHRAGGASIILDLIINGFLAGAFIIFFNFARKGQKWAFRVGMAFYALTAF